MDTGIVDLYQYFAVEKPRGAQGRLTYYAPDAVFPDAVRPAVLILPGGGYQHVSAREAEPVALRFTAKGYCAFVLDYAVAPCAYPVALREAAMAMAYIRRNALLYALDEGMVAAVGFSAGGHLCGCLGMLYDREVVADIAEPQLLRPDALGLCYPVAVSWGRTHPGSFENLCGDDGVLRQQLSLEGCVRPDMPPVFLWHTCQDASVPCRNSLILAQALEEQQVPFALHIYHKGPHGLSVADETAYPAGQVPEISRDVPDWVEKMQDFFEEFGFSIKRKEVAL